MIKAINALNNAGASEVYAWATHGVLHMPENDVHQKLEQADGLKYLLISNSVAATKEKEVSSKIRKQQTSFSLSPQSQTLRGQSLRANWTRCRPCRMRDSSCSIWRDAPMDSRRRCRRRGRSELCAGNNVCRMGAFRGILSLLHVRFLGTSQRDTRKRAAVPFVSEQPSDTETETRTKRNSWRVRGGRRREG